jgi:hypothetical protein
MLLQPRLLFNLLRLPCPVWPTPSLAVLLLSKEKVSTSGGSQRQGCRAEIDSIGLLALVSGSIPGSSNLNNLPARASMPWRKVGLEGNKPIPRAWFVKRIIPEVLDDIEVVPALKEQAYLMIRSRVEARILEI